MKEQYGIQNRTESLSNEIAAEQSTVAENAKLVGAVAQWFMHKTRMYAKRSLNLKRVQQFGNAAAFLMLGFGASDLAVHIEFPLDFGVVDVNLESYERLRLFMVSTQPHSRRGAVSQFSDCLIAVAENFSNLDGVEMLGLLPADGLFFCRLPRVKTVRTGDDGRKPGWRLEGLPCLRRTIRNGPAVQRPRKQSQAPSGREKHGVMLARSSRLLCSDSRPSTF